MPDRNIVSREAWLEARIAHLEREKEFTRLRDELTRDRKELPWVREISIDRIGTLSNPMAD